MGKPNLGDRVRDRISGFEGIVTARAEYLYGVPRVLVTATELPKDGKAPETVWLDSGQAEVVFAEAVAVAPQ